MAKTHELDVEQLTRGRAKLLVDPLEVLRIALVPLRAHLVRAGLGATPVLGRGSRYGTGPASGSIVLDLGPFEGAMVEAVARETRIELTVVPSSRAMRATLWIAFGAGLLAAPLLWKTLLPEVDLIPGLPLGAGIGCVPMLALALTSKNNTLLVRGRSRELAKEVDAQVRAWVASFDD